MTAYRPRRTGKMKEVGAGMARRRDHANPRGSWYTTPRPFDEVIDLRLGLSTEAD